MANGLKKSKDEVIDVIQDDVTISKEALKEIPKAKSPKDTYAIPELKEEDKIQVPGHTRRDFRN
jgi:hypothetical protein